MTDTKSTTKQTNKTADTQKNTKVVKATTVKSGNKTEVLYISKTLDMFLWLVAFILLIGAIGGNFYYTQHFVVDESSLGRLSRVAIVIATIAVALIVVLFTNKGHKLLAFGKESYIELRKVVWPTRPEAVQTTIIVFIAVCVVSLFLYLCDVVFLQIVRAITL